MSDVVKPACLKKTLSLGLFLIRTLIAVGNSEIATDLDTLQFDPETGMPVQSVPRTFTVDELRQFIRQEIGNSGLLKRLALESAAVPMALTAETIIQMAKSDARKHHNGTSWGAGGGLAGCGLAVLGAIVGATILEFPGFLLGTGLGLFGAPLLLAGLSTSHPSPSQALRGATPDKIELYRQSYAAETRKLRLSSILRGEVSVAATAAIGLLLLIIVAE